MKSRLSNTIWLLVIINAAALFAVGMGRYGTTDARVVAANLQPLGVTMNATIPFLV